MKEIIIALPRQNDGKKIQEILQRHGLTVSLVCTSASSVLQQVSAGSDGGIIITAARLCDMHFSKLREYIPSSYSLMLLAKASTLARESTGDIVSLEMPIRSFELVNTVFMMLGISGEEQKAVSRKKKRNMRDENYINNAKQLLMERNHMSEEDAHRYIQKTSMDSGRSMAQTAQMILMLMYDI